MTKKFEMRNSTVEFLTFVAANKEDGVQEAATTEKISVVQLEGSRNVNREPTYYNLDAIIAAGYCVSKTVLSGIHTINVMKVGGL